MTPSDRPVRLAAHRTPHTSNGHSPNPPGATSTPRSAEGISPRPAAQTTPCRDCDGTGYEHAYGFDGKELVFPCMGCDATGVDRPEVSLRGLVDDRFVERRRAQMRVVDGGQAA